MGRDDLYPFHARRACGREAQLRSRVRRASMTRVTRRPRVARPLRSRPHGAVSNGGCRRSKPVGRDLHQTGCPRSLLSRWCWPRPCSITSRSNRSTRGRSATTPGFSHGERSANAVRRRAVAEKRRRAPVMGPSSRRRASQSVDTTSTLLCVVRSGRDSGSARICAMPAWSGPGR